MDTTNVDDNDASHSSDTSFHSDQTGQQTSSNGTEEPLAARESMQVQQSKILVYLSLTLAALSVGVATYFFVKNEEETSFEREFLVFTDRIVSSADANALATFRAVNDIAVAIQAEALNNNEQWPYTTNSFFERRVELCLEETGSEVIAFAPIVLPDDKDDWVQYAVDHQGWLKEGLVQLGLDDIDPGNITDDIQGNYNGTFHVPLWQIAPAPRNASVVMRDLMMESWFHDYCLRAVQVDHSILSNTHDLEPYVQYSRPDDTGNIHPRSLVMKAIFNKFEIFKDFDTKLHTHQPVGFALAIVPWEKYFQNLLPDDKAGFYVNVIGSCGAQFTYNVKGSEAEFLGYQLVHDPKYDHLKQVFDFAKFARLEGGNQTAPHVLREDLASDEDYATVFHQECSFAFEIYPSDELRESYMTIKPILYAFVIVMVFVATMMVFVIYDWTVKRRQEKILATTKRTTAIVKSMFPKNVQKRIMEEAEKSEAENSKFRGLGFKSRVSEALDDTNHSQRASKGTPIADLFPETTILFGDIVGFTAWSSMREPAQVFTLLESIFFEFDEIAKRRRVFKVETVGDCYVAVSGLPEPNKNHAVVMARFTRDCLFAFNVLMTELELTLGPETSDLGMRFGLHSGPVTAGVLRGNRARFQLFGDTMNTASRIESTGQKNKIHMSQETADRLALANKSHWFVKREDKVVAKGKGELQTYWLDLKTGRAASSKSGGSDNSQAGDATEGDADKNDQEIVTKEITLISEFSAKQTRLLNWVIEILTRSLQAIVARREVSGVKADTLQLMKLLENSESQSKVERTVIDEVEDVITLPSFNADVVKEERSIKVVHLDDHISEQLRDYVQTISLMYKDNPFHNFEHISHVMMSVVKLLSRIIAPKEECQTDASLHDHTYGITSDPLTQFGVIFSALIHDVDHQGVTNADLIKEGAGIASMYKNKSIAEQNSFDLAWRLLMDDRFQDLRRCIYTNRTEFTRFRQLVVNSVIATDIMDNDLSAARKARWHKAFSEEPVDEGTTTLMINRRATIVIEHLIQASDVVHTMQHWQVFRKWNERLFRERYKAYKDGRSDIDPSIGWYDGEKNFFDFYIIPLAKKLKECGVFGASSAEYLNYAEQNCREWESKGLDIVADMLVAANRDFN